MKVTAISMGPMKKYKKSVFADAYLNDKEKYDAQSDWCDVEPVDMNGGFVATDKYAKDNLKNTEENIRERFSLDNEGGED